MSSTNKTTYYELPQFVDSDLFNPLVDDNDAYEKIDTALHQIAEAEVGDAGKIVDIKSRLDSAENSIDALETQNGSEALTTTAQTLSGAVNELDSDIASLDDRLDVVEDDINNANTGLKVKVDSLTTTVGKLETDLDNTTNLVNTEIEDRRTAIADVEYDLQLETANRQSADTALETSISEEATARILAVANEANARTTADALINGRIDELVAPSGQAPNPAEIVDARIGANSETYNSLGDAIRGQVGYLENAINQYDATVGLVDIVTGDDEATSNGITVTKTGSIINFNGSATNTARFKLSKDIKYDIAIQDSWLTERLDNIQAGKKYKLAISIIGGSATESNTIRILASDGSVTARCTFDGHETYISDEFTATSDNCACVVINFFPVSATYSNLKVKIALIDIENANTFAVTALDNTLNEAITPVKSDLAYAEREIDSILPFTDDWHYSEITKTVGTYTNSDDETTTYYVVSIPLRDTKGDIIPIYADYNTSYSPMQYAEKFKTSVTANSGMVSNNKQGAVIKDGVIVHENEYPATASTFLVYVGFDASRNIHEYQSNVSGTYMVNDGIRNASIAYYKLVENGVLRDVSDIGLPDSNLIKNPRMAMFIKSDKTICFIACDGRTDVDAGLTPSELGNLMISLGAVNGWNLDGGGSTSLNLNGVKLNKHIDDDGTIDRAIHVTWDVSGIIPSYILPSCDKEINGTYTLKCIVNNGQKQYEWISV